MTGRQLLCVLMNGKMSRCTTRKRKIFIVLFYLINFIALNIQAILVGDFTRSLWPGNSIVLARIPFAIERKDTVFLLPGLKMMDPFALFLPVTGRIMR